MSTDTSPAPDKLVYLAPRPAQVGTDHFLRHWRERSESNMALPAFQRFTRYEQCPLITGADAADLPELFGPNGPASRFGGVGAGNFTGGLETLREMAADPRGAERDEQTFGEPLMPHLLITQEEVVLDDGETEVRIYSFLKRQRRLSQAEFSEQWRNFADTFRKHEQLVRHCSSYVQDHVVIERGAAYDGVAEMGFRSVADALAFMSEPSLVEELYPLEEPFIDRSGGGLVALTRVTRLLQD